MTVLSEAASKGGDQARQRTPRAFPISATEAVAAAQANMVEMLRQRAEEHDLLVAKYAARAQLWSQFATMMLLWEQRPTTYWEGWNGE